tara:strand:+ start:640 stop:1023 length:384 start_codon:yes stop_codon:yes gene_type:complete
MVNTEEKPEDSSSDSELDDEEVSQLKSLQRGIIDLKHKVKYDVLREIIGCVENHIDKMVIKIIEDFKNDDSKKSICVSTTHDYPCGKCSTVCENDIVSMRKILRNSQDAILSEVVSCISSIINREGL